MKDAWRMPWPPPLPVSLCASECGSSKRRAACGAREGRTCVARTGLRVTSVKRVEREVRKFEGFDIAMHYAGRDRRNVRDDRKRIPSYRGKYKRKARDRFTVADWKRVRFARHYPGFEVDVLDATGRVADGRVRLSNLRSHYG